MHWPRPVHGQWTWITPMHGAPTSHQAGFRSLAPNPPCWPAPQWTACREEIVHVLQSTTPEDMERNVEQLAAWCRTWRPAS